MAPRLAFRSWLPDTSENIVRPSCLEIPGNVCLRSFQILYKEIQRYVPESKSFVSCCLLPVSWCLLLVAFCTKPATSNQQCSFILFTFYFCLLSFVFYLYKVFLARYLIPLVAFRQDVITGLFAFYPSLHLLRNAVVFHL